MGFAWGVTIKGSETMSLIRATAKELRELRKGKEAR